MPLDNSGHPCLIDAMTNAPNTQTWHLSSRICGEVVGPFPTRTALLAYAGPAIGGYYSGHDITDETYDQIVARWDSTTTEGIRVVPATEWAYDSAGVLWPVTSSTEGTNA